MAGFSGAEGDSTSAYVFPVGASFVHLFIFMFLLRFKIINSMS